MQYILPFFAGLFLSQFLTGFASDYIDYQWPLTAGEKIGLYLFVAVAYFCLLFIPLYCALPPEAGSSPYLAFAAGVSVHWCLLPLLIG